MNWCVESNTWRHWYSFFFFLCQIHFYSATFEKRYHPIYLGSWNTFSPHYRHTCVGTHVIIKGGNAEKELEYLSNWNINALSNLSIRIITNNCDPLLPAELTVPAFFFLLYQGARKSKWGFLLTCAIFVLDAKGFFLLLESSAKLRWRWKIKHL